jgi:hypothetical protein
LAGEVKGKAEELDGAIHVERVPEKNADPAAAGENMVRLGSTGAYQLIAHVLGEGNVHQTIPMDMADLSSAQGVFRASKAMRVGGDP